MERIRPCDTSIRAAWNCPSVS